MNELIEMKLNSSGRFTSPAPRPVLTPRLRERSLSANEPDPLRKHNQETEVKRDDAFMIGNAFPLTLIRHRVMIEPVHLEEVRRALQHRPWISFWGHENTLLIAKELLKTDITPQGTRPAITLQEDGIPQLGGRRYRQCYILSADYEPGYRPAIGEEVGTEHILGWQALRIDWD